MYLLFDIGGTKTRIGWASNLAKIEKFKIFLTPQSFRAGVLFFKKLASEKNYKFKAVAGGIAGPLDSKKTKLVNSPNLPDWIGKPFKSSLYKIFKTQVFLENDAALGGLGEAVFGAGRNFKIVAYLTVGTGVGGARIVDRTIDRNIFGFEPGHQIILHHSDIKKIRRLQEWVSGKAIKALYHQTAEKIKGKTIWQEQARWLAYGVHNTILYWSPEVVVLGGSLITKNPGINLDLVFNDLKKLLLIFPKSPPLKKAELQETSGLYGGLALLQKKLKGS
jgi:predicted NBD/HSP70 family sugar kinase